MPQRRPYGSSCLSNRFSVSNLFPSNFIQTTSLQLDLQKTINTMPEQNTLTSIITLSTGSSIKVLFNSFTAQLTTWLLTCSPKPSLLQKSSISPCNSGFHHLEGECWITRCQCPQEWICQHQGLLLSHNFKYPFLYLLFYSHSFTY